MFLCILHILKHYSHPRVACYAVPCDDCSFWLHIAVMWLSNYCSTHLNVWTFFHGCYSVFRYLQNGHCLHTLLHPGYIWMSDLIIALWRHNWKPLSTSMSHFNWSCVIFKWALPNASVSDFKDVSLQGISECQTYSV